MSAYEIVQAAMANAFRVTQEPDFVRVVTHVLYPSSSFVQVVVSGGQNAFVVSDEGGAIRELQAAGAELKRPERLVRHLVKDRGLLMHNGVLRSPVCDATSLPVAIALIASASRDVADWLFVHFKIKRPSDFKRIVAEYLRARYDNIVRNETIVGKSNKAHKFENLITFPDGIKIIVDPVLNDSASINARLVANLDVAAAKYEKLEQRIVYDDQEDWTPENLSLLQVGATVIPFSRAPAVLERIRAYAPP